MADDVFTSITWFRVKPGRDDHFIRAFVDAGMESRPWSIPGYRGVTMFRSHTDSDLYYVIGSWDSTDSYGEWRKVARSGAPVGTLDALSDAIVESGPGNILSPVVLPVAGE